MNDVTIEKPVIHDAIYNLITNHLNNNADSEKMGSLYAFLIEQIEPPLLDAAMKKTKWNQVRAAKLLGLSRGTLRKKLKEHFDDKYCGTRETND